MSEVILKSENLVKRFGFTTAVNEVSIAFEKGEIHGLIGENGSGKSTFCSMLCGIQPITSGRFLFEGREFRARSQVEANHGGVSIIVQEIGTLAGLTVAENIFLGEEERFMHGPVKDTQGMNREAQKLLDSYGFGRIGASKIIDYYSFEDRKLIEIVKATYFQPKIVVIDETTTALSQAGREELFKVMKRIRESGNTVIFISHDLEEVMEYCDRITILRDGKMIRTVERASTSSAELKHLMVGRELDNRYYRTDFGRAISDEVVLSVDAITVPGKLQDVSLKLHRGEILGIGGLSECGMHEIGKAIFGASYERSGEVALSNGYKVNSIVGAIRHGIAYASKDRDNESIVVADTICDNICLPSLEEMSSHAIIQNRKLKDFAKSHAQLMSVKMTGVQQYVSNLSGGNKQKVVLARWIGKNSEILVLDSPTRGIDVKVKADIYALMSELTAKGKSIIMISEELQELIGMSDRILIMKDGKINGEFLRSETLSEKDLIVNMV